jgi:hypothetical protein
MMDDPAKPRNCPPEDGPQSPASIDRRPPPCGRIETDGQRVKLTAGVLALDRRDGTTRGTYIEAGEIVTVKAVPAGGDLLAEVEWNGRVLAMFTRDLLDHSERL